MTNCNASFSHRKQYITPINRAFGEKFQNMDEFKEVLEPGGINHSESSRNNQSELIRNSQCTCLAN